MLPEELQRLSVFKVMLPEELQRLLVLKVMLPRRTTAPSVFKVMLPLKNWEQRLPDLPLRASGKHEFRVERGISQELSPSRPQSMLATSLIRNENVARRLQLLPRTDPPRRPPRPALRRRASPPRPPRSSGPARRAGRGLSPTWAGCRRWERSSACILCGPTMPGSRARRPRL